MSWNRISFFSFIFIHPFPLSIRPLTLSLFPYLGYCEYSCNKHRSVYIYPFNKPFSFPLDTLKWDCQILWKFHFWFFWRIFISFSTTAEQVHTPINMHKGSLSSTSLPTLMSRLRDGEHSYRCDVISHHGFDFTSLMINDVEHLCMDLLAIWRSSLEKNVDLVPQPIF